MSWTTRKSSRSNRRLTRCPSASDCTGFSPMTYRAAQLAALHGVHHGGLMLARPGRDAAPPRAARKRPQAGVVGDELEARQPVGQGAHVAAALHVVLTAERRRAGARLAPRGRSAAPGCQRVHVVGGVVVFGDPERPAQHGPRRPRVQACQPPESSCAGMPVSGSARARVGLRATRGVRSKSRVARSTNGGFSRPSARITCPMALASAIRSPP